MRLYQESIKSYMQSIATLPLVSVEDEIELAKLIEDGSEEARETLIVANLKLVVKIAHDYKSLGVPLADLISEDNVSSASNATPSVLSCIRSTCSSRFSFNAWSSSESSSDISSNAILIVYMYEYVVDTCCKIYT